MKYELLAKEGNEIKSYKSVKEYMLDFSAPTNLFYDGKRLERLKYYDGYTIADEIEYLETEIKFIDNFKGQDITGAIRCDNSKYIEEQGCECGCLDAIAFNIRNLEGKTIKKALCKECVKKYKAKGYTLKKCCTTKYYVKGDNSYEN